MAVESVTSAAGSKPPAAPVEAAAPMFQPVRTRRSAGGGRRDAAHLRHVGDYLESENRKTERKRKIAA
jgi:hypothetical protein